MKMRAIAFGLFAIATLFSCMLYTKINPPGNHEFEIVETQMAEIREDHQPEIQISKKDSIEFLKFWKEFYKCYQENDIQSLTRLSFDSVKSPIFLETQNRFQLETKYISFTDFLNAPIRNKTISTTIALSKKDPQYVIYRYKYNPDITNKGSKGDSVLLNYYVWVDSKEIKGNYEIPRIILFSFIKKNKRIRFSGLEINGEGYARPLNDSTTRSHLYFPLYRKTQDPTKNLTVLDTFTNLWFSACLSDFKEPNLYTYSGDDDIYRFTWLRSFNHPITIRFQKHENDYVLTTKEMIDNNGYIPNEFVVNTNQILNITKWDHWEFKLGRINFWNKAALDAEPRGTDGADWVLESKVKGKYHFVTRACTDPGFRECCKYLLKLSKLKIPEDEIY